MGQTARPCSRLRPCPARRRAARAAPFGPVGDYELLEEIARGGMGVVYKARQVEPRTALVALKMILAGSYAGAEADVRRFRTEAEAAANLDHPHIVPIYEVGEHEGQHYFSMKLRRGRQPGRTARRAAAAARAARPSWSRPWPRAVHYAHQHGILHRDLKPANILLDARRRAARHRLRPGQAASTGDRGLTPDRRHRRHAQLHAAGAGVGQTDRSTPRGRRLQPGRDPVRLLTGRPPFQAATPLDTLLQVLATGAGAAASLNPQVPRPGDDLPEVPGEGARRGATPRPAAGRRPRAASSTAGRSTRSRRERSSAACGGAGSPPQAGLSAGILLLLGLLVLSFLVGRGGPPASGDRSLQHPSGKPGNG